MSVSFRLGVRSLRILGTDFLLTRTGTRFRPRWGPSVTTQRTGIVNKDHKCYTICVKIRKMFIIKYLRVLFFGSSFDSVTHKCNGSHVPILIRIRETEVPEVEVRSCKRRTFPSPTRLTKALREGRDGPPKVFEGND